MTFSGHFEDRNIVLAIVTLILFVTIAVVFNARKNLVRMSCDILRTERVNSRFGPRDVFHCSVSSVFDFLFAEILS